MRRYYCRKCEKDVPSDRCPNCDSEAVAVDESNLMLYHTIVRFILPTVAAWNLYTALNKITAGEIFDASLALICVGLSVWMLVWLFRLPKVADELVLVGEKYVKNYTSYWCRWFLASIPVTLMTLCHSHEMPVYITFIVIFESLWPFLFIAYYYEERAGMFRNGRKYRAFEETMPSIIFSWAITALSVVFCLLILSGMIK